MAAYEAEKSRFERLNAHVLGISTDAVPTKAAWAKSFGGF
jgi:alkyl hydroperoxide reductase subunit AhpC